MNKTNPSHAEQPRPLYIFDLDGTLALIEHRRHFVEGPVKDWPAFFAACKDDKPNPPVIATLNALLKSDAHVWIWSGRSNEVENETLEWLKENVPDWWVGHGKLRMRIAGDHQIDETLKFSWLMELGPTDRKRLVAIFDDRTRVVEMWRKEGIACFQVAPGDF